MPPLQLWLLGPPRLVRRDNGRSLALDRLPAALFALLALDGPTHRDRIVSLLWSGTEAFRPAGHLRKLRESLREGLGTEGLAAGDWLALADGVQHDLSPLDTLAPPDTDEPRALMTWVRSLPRGELLGHYAYRESPELHAWVQARRGQRRAQLRALQGQVLQRLQQGGHLDTAVALAEGMLLAEPQAESAYARLAQLHWARGDRQAVREVLARCRAMLAQARIFALGPALAELEQRMLTQGTQAPAGAGPVTPDELMALPPLVGREAEWRALDAAWRAGRPLLLEGEPGVGKSRLLDGFCAARPTAVSVRAVAGDAHQPYALLRRVLRALLPRCLAHLSSPQRATLAHVLPELDAAVGPAPGPARLAEAVRVVLALARERRVPGLVLDDLHWADTASLTLLLEGASHLGAQGPRWVLACRLHQRPPALRDWPPLREGQVQVLPLQGLDEAGLCALLKALRWSAEAAQAWVPPLQARTLGNPMHVLESLAAIGQHLGPQALAQVCPDTAAWPAPESLIHLVAQRLQGLPAGARELAVLAGLAGDALTPALAREAMAGTPMAQEDSLVRAWQALEASDILRDDRLRHDVLREAVRATLPAALQQEWHGRIADTAVARSWPAAQQAWHLQRAARWAPAAAQWQQAAQQAHLLNLRGDELRAWQRAAECLDQAGDRDAAFDARVQALDAALIVLPASEALPLAEALQAAARSEAQQLQAATARVRVCLDLDDPAPGLAAADTVLALLERSGRWPPRPGDLDSLQLLGPVGATAELLMLAARPGPAWQLLHPAEALLQAVPDNDAALWSLRSQWHNALAGVLSRLGQRVEGEHHAHAALALAERASDWTAAVLASDKVVGMATQRGDVQAAVAAAEKGLVCRQRLGDGLDGVVPTVAQMVLGMAQAAAGRYGDALHNLITSRNAFDRSGAPQWVADCDTHRARIALYLGDLALAASLAGPTLPGTDGSAQVRRVVQLMVRRWQGEDILTALRQLQADMPVLRADVSAHIELMAARAQGGATGADAAAALLAQCQAQGLLGQAQHARVVLAECLLQAGRRAAAAAVVREALAAMPACVPSGLYTPELHLAAWRCLAAEGDAEGAAAALQAGVSWVQHCATHHLGAEPRERFLSGNPVNRALLHAAARA
jgi:DNA-binding SARP family transcriptional activator/tetratricopeptide (TPR) repeat protein